MSDQITPFLPFAGVLAAVALGPSLRADLWHRLERPVLTSLIIAALYLTASLTGVKKAAALSLHVFWFEYLPFLLLLTALYGISHGLHIKVAGRSTPFTNVLFLAVGAVFSSFIGTTGAALTLFKPWISLNADRTFKTHLVIFFIFIVANIGGCLTPFGDPPLFFGFLKGVPFAWPAVNLWKPWLFTMLLILSVFYFVDLSYAGRDQPLPADKAKPFTVSLEGGWYLVLLAALIITVILTALLPDYGNWIRNMIIFGIIILGYQWYNDHDRATYSRATVGEIAWVFGAVFMTLIPVYIAFDLHPDWFRSADWTPMKYFWSTGILSAFLDNAPTYVLFLEAAGGTDAALAQPAILTAISLGAVFMGAMTYIGNAPNFVLRSLAAARNIPMPDFLGYMRWSFGILIPVFALMAWLFLR